MKELKSKHQLNTIIVNKNGKPYKTAIEIYWYLRSWYTPIKAKKFDGSTVNISKINTDGIHICKKKLQQKFSCGPEAVRRAIVFLEELGLVSRGFEKKGKSVNHLVLYVWKHTPNFSNSFGTTREEVGDLQNYTNNKYIAKKVDTPIHLKGQKSGYPLSSQSGHPVHLEEKRKTTKKVDTKPQLIKGVEGDKGYPLEEEGGVLVKVDTDNKGKKIDIEISPKDISISTSSSRGNSELKLKNKIETSQAKNSTIEFAEKSPTDEILEEAAKTSYAFGGDKVLPQSEDTSTELVAGNLALAKDTAETETPERVEIEIPWLAKGENDNTSYSLANSESMEAEQGVSEEEHYKDTGSVPLPEPEETDAKTTKPDTEAEVKTLFAKEDSSTSSEVKQNLLSEDDVKWQNIHKLVLEKFASREELAYGILHNMTITAIRPNRIGLSFSRDLGFSEEEKEMLRLCLRDVYGPNIEMVILRPEVDIDAEKDKVRVHLIAENDTRLPEGLKKQFEQLDECKKAYVSLEKNQEELVKTDEIYPASIEASADLGSEVFDHPLAFAKHKWNEVRLGVIDGVYGSYAEQMEDHLSNVEVLGMTGRVLRLEAWWLTCDKMRDQQDLVERVAKKYDVDLEIKNREDGDVFYMPWTYPSNELPPLELESILKKVK